jgi:hypothetical protein
MIVRTSRATGNHTTLTSKKTETIPMSKTSTNSSLKKFKWRLQKSLIKSDWNVSRTSSWNHLDYLNKKILNIYISQEIFYLRKGKKSTSHDKRVLNGISQNKKETALEAI